MDISSKELQIFSIFVILEILYKYRVGIFYPSGGLDTDAASKYTPAYGVCSQVRNDAQFTECCKDMETMYGQFNPFTSVEYLAFSKDAPTKL